MSDVADHDARTADDQRGPWVLALGALAIGGVAFSVEAYRALRDRRRGDGPTDAE